MTQRDKGEPCAVCGHGPDTGIHLPALTGDRKGLPWGHTYVPQRLNPNLTPNSGDEKHG